MHRLAYPLLMMLLPRFIPQLLKCARLVWRLIFDPRVNIILRALVPLAVVYVIIPTDLVKDRIPIIGRFDDIIVFGMAALTLVKLAPRDVVNQHLGIKPDTSRPEDQDPKNVVDGSARDIDD